MWEVLRVQALAIRKYGVYGATCQDPRIRQLLQDAQARHVRRYHALLRRLQEQAGLAAASGQPAPWPTAAGVGAPAAGTGMAAATSPAGWPTAAGDQAGAPAYARAAQTGAAGQPQAAAGASFSNATYGELTGAHEEAALEGVAGAGETAFETAAEPGTPAERGGDGPRRR